MEWGADDTELLESGLERKTTRLWEHSEDRVGDMVGRYQLRRLLGQGGMGRVFLARDTTLGRSVALKLIRPERISQTEAEHFIGEAQITARLNHPHIVQLYDVGRHRDSVFLTLEYLDGESLQRRISREPMTTDEVLRLAGAIAEALCHAHAARVFHCDLKPNNVILPTDGRIRVLDFGLATVGDGRMLSGGTPDWMAPEQWRHECPTDRADVWALAVMIHGLLDGVHPFGPATSAEQRRALVLADGVAPHEVVRGGIPDAVRRLLLQSLERDPLARPTAETWATVLREAITPTGMISHLESPFCGLSAFDEGHAAFFFGREVEIDAFLERLRTTPTLPVIGPSGAGKSSFLHAGVVPRLRARGRWFVITMRPGRDPFTNLARELLRGGAGDDTVNHDDLGRLAAELRATPSLLAARLATISAARGSSVLLVCDQLEELFTQALPDDAARFITALTSAADDAREPVRISYSLRDDFLGHMPEIAHLFVLRRLDISDLRRTVIGPTERLGYRFENPAIVDEMLEEVRGSAFELPLLQFACRTLWESRDTNRRLLLESSYRSHGGVARALAHHAEGVLAGMSSFHQRLARQILGKLVTGTSSRRTVELSALLKGLPDDAASVIERLVAARLLVQRAVPGDDQIVIELAHESLLVTWGQLAHWLEDTREERRILEELEDMAAAWIRRGRRPEHTAGDDELAAARERIARLGISVPPEVQAYLDAGEARRRSQQRRQRTRVAIALIGATAITGVSLWLARSFRDQKNAAQAQAAALALAARNQGTVDLTVEVRDRLPDGEIVPPDQLPDLAVSVYAAERGDFNHPGHPVASNLVEIRRAGGRFHVEAPGGIAFLRIDGRGRAGERCAASWIRIEEMPGYADHGAKMTVEIPSCSASARDTVEIPAGEFIYGGPGQPATRFPAYVEPERVVHLDRYAIDREEVSNATFKTFAAMAAITGYPVPKYPEGEGLPLYPVTSIDLYEAEAFCRYMGKRLPSDYEWTKAARGGLAVGGVPNPYPRRLYPWGIVPRPTCANSADPRDGYEWVAPTSAMPCGASPYGVLDLAGNVAEWISQDGRSQPAPLPVVRGGSAESPPDLEQTTTVFRNAREARHFDFVTGIRCVTDGDTEKGSRWDRH